MGSVGQYNQIEPDLQVPNYTVNPNVCTVEAALCDHFGPDQNW
jgi:hypothetical protein